MTLIIEKFGKPDTREIEYDQRVVELGLKKSEAQAELERVLSEIVSVAARRDKFNQEIIDAKKKLKTVKAEIKQAIKNGQRNLSDLNLAQNESGQLVNQKTGELKQLDNHLVSLEKKINQYEILFDSAKKRLDKTIIDLNKVKSELNQIQTEKNNLDREIVSLQELKSELNEEIKNSEKVFAYIEKQTKFLGRKEADLKVYEKRLEEQRLEAGVTGKMTFK